MTEWVFPFGASAEGCGHVSADILGGKGANLHDMAGIGLPVPPGFVISTTACGQFNAGENRYPDGLASEVQAGLSYLETTLERGFGDEDRPLLLSVRSGARVSMPGMMDTVLNLGLNDQTVAGLARISGDRRFAWDSYRRFIQMYADVVLGVEHGLFETALSEIKRTSGAASDADLSAEQLNLLVSRYRAIVAQETGNTFPQNVVDQLWGAISAVFGSWNSERAIIYRRINGITEALGTAVTVQAMVFGNRGQNSATGVAFTRNPSFGERGLFGEFLVNAQGEDVVAGIRTPLPITKSARIAAGCQDLSLEEVMPAAFDELQKACNLLELRNRDMQDIEFTIEEGRLWLLQTRNGKRTAFAAVKIAVDLVDEGLVSKTEALKRVEADSLNQLLHPRLAPEAHQVVAARGLPASPGAAMGRLALDTGAVDEFHAQGEPVILARVETSPDDIHGMHIARGIVTVRGGMTSHAAVVARGMGRPCVSSVSDLKIDMTSRTIQMGDIVLQEGDFLTIDGSSGNLYAGQIPTVKAELSADFERFMSWADEVRRLRVRANADSPEDAATARSLGAEGIGLCRTEHMFFEPNRIAAVREMILASNEDDRRKALSKLLPDQRSDFVGIFTVMQGYPVTIRLLDPPLHEFLPHTEAEFADLAESSGVEIKDLVARAHELKEFNPMLGHRGCRLAVTYPEIYEMQARAIFEAACLVEPSPQVEIMVPLTVSAPELAAMRLLIDETAEAVFAEQGKSIAYLVGSMIEVPRAALRAGDLAQFAEFFSFGTNDLTQTTMGMSRDDAAPFLAEYVSRNLIKSDPFVNLDVEGVGELMQIASDRARKTNPNIKLGICGEHGGDPSSIAACEAMGLHYVSASPYRIPVARLAAAQATLTSLPRP